MAADAFAAGAGQVVLLAGATGQLGAEFARRVLRSGGSVAATVRREWQVARLRSELGEPADRLLVGVVGPRDSEAAAGFVKGAGDALGPIAALVVAAGLFRTAEVGTEPAGELEELLEANLLAGATLVRAALPGMRRRRRGTITFVGSAGVGSDFGLSPNYLASKAAVHEYVRALASSLRDSGVTAAAIVPATLDSAAKVEAALMGLARLAFDPEGAAAAGQGPLFPLAFSD
ncbi:MAG: SDR family NAD(P)-dependent oxidoreductase [Planctomycetes bacterium]|nr:SDR family NAD(P)-dependent oxidoreductase [Planctomycetota bacterium]